MRPFVLLAAALALPMSLSAPANAEMPAWSSGEWRTNARLTAPDGTRLRIRCTLDAASASAAAWGGTLNCGTVQGRFEGQWQVNVSGASVNGTVVFSGTENDQVAISGTMSEAQIDLSSNDGQGVAFAPGADGALIVEMMAVGPQRLTGTLTFESR